MIDDTLLTVSEMGRADALAVEAGVPSLELMENAGRAVADEIKARWERRPVVILCGPGNNGGDGFVIARHLGQDDWPIRLALLGDSDALTGDAAVNAGRWGGKVEALDPEILSAAPLVVDALFGAGLSRPLDGLALAVVEAINSRSLDCVAVDMPSGVDGDSGAVLGGAAQARLTVTFFRPKPGHLLQPGRDLAGEIAVADIGIPNHVLDVISPSLFVNGPRLWGAGYPWPAATANKYDRGHAVIVGGSVMTGAARLVARGARRVGAGLVTIASPPAAVATYATDWPGTMVSAVADTAALAQMLEDRRLNAIAIGPGAGIEDNTRAEVLACLASGRSCVVDADGLSVFRDHTDDLFSAIGTSCVLTPHEGEFSRLFSISGDRLTRCRTAAAISGAVVLLKGSDTIIAAPGGRTVINREAPPELATAGSGDVLAGLIVGLLAQGMEPFDAACAATWLHGQAASRFGIGLIAEDLPDMLPAVLGDLRNEIGPKA